MSLERDVNQLAAGHRLHRVSQHFDDLVHVGAQSVYVVEAQDRLGVPRGEVVEPGLVGEQVRDRGSTSM